MDKVFFTPGPSQILLNVEIYIQEAIKNGICSISHRGKEFEDIFQNSISSLRNILNVPEDFHIFFISSATEAMERIIENCVESCSFHFVNGAFSDRFFKTALELRKSPKKIEAQYGDGFEFSKITVPDNSELVCLTQNETSTGVALNMQDIYNIKKKYTDKLIAVDIVSSVPYVDIDYSMVDCTFFSVQKGFGMPPGLGVIIVNDAAVKKSQYLQNKSLNIGSYHSFPSLLRSAEKNQTPETPNTLWIYLLDKICNDFMKIGLNKIRNDTDKKANLLYDFFDSNSKYKPFVKNKYFRSKTIIVVNVPNSIDIIDKLKSHGFIVGSGYKEFKDKQIRIANFPAHKIDDIKRLIKIIKSIEL